ncbi:MAG: DNA-processing protein DprA [Gammaproteobacteria bacterium]|nr:DNA-processing protein DprA [Gammaproteobacteria bacterium]
MEPPADKYYLAALIHTLGRSRAAELLAAGASPREACAAIPQAQESPERLAALCRDHGIALLTPVDGDYPALLRYIPDPPPLLYAWGQCSVLRRPAVAIVGARRCSRGGAEVAAALAHALAAHGVSVVSGLARGIDSAAHRGALSAGVTVAVIGSGLLRPYPAGNRALVRSIVDAGGLLLSEYPPLAGARPYHFPERNRLISGLALGVVVVEAGERSGSLITARMALEQGREVCAVPGAVANPASRGCHRLLRDGAVLVECADHILEAVGLTEFANTRPAPAEAGQSMPADADLVRLLEAVSAEVSSLDELVAATGMDGRAAAAALVELELSGFVRQVPGGYIRRPRL